MPSGRPRTPSRGRATTTRRAQSASRKAKSPTKKKSKSPQKATPKPKSRSSSRSRKVATAPAAVSGKRRETPRPASPRGNAPAKKAPSVSSRGTPRPTSSITVSTTSMTIPRGSASPPMLRSRQLGVALAQQAPQKSMAVARKGPPRKSWRDAIKDNIVTRQFGKMAKSIKRGPRPMFKSTVKHVKDNAKFYILAFVVLIVAGIIYKFQRELLTNVQQINKQVVEFVQQQYEQQRQIFGEYMRKTQEAMEQARQKYLSGSTESPSSPPPQSPTSPPPPKPTRTPHLTDTI